VTLLLAIVVAMAPPTVSEIDFEALDDAELVAYIETGGYYHRARAAATLARRGTRKTPLFLGLLGSEDPQTRRAVCDAFGRSGLAQASVVERLSEIVRDDADMWVRAGAADALGRSRLEDRDIDAVLMVGAKDPHYWVREASMRGLRERLVRKVVEDEDRPAIYEVALTIAGGDDINYNVWRYAVPIIRAGGGAEDPSVIPVMTKLLGRAPHGMWGVGVIKDAAALLETHGADSRSAVPTLIAAAEKFGLPVLRISLVRALGAVGPDARSSVPRLEDLLAGEENEDVRTAIREAIDRIKPAAP
jgi:HEAT repeat protein